MADYGAGFETYCYNHDSYLWYQLDVWERSEEQVPNRIECPINSSVMQCQVMNAAMRMLDIRPEETVNERDLSKVITRWRTVRVAMCIESSSPESVSH
jgi:hypothetical protein